MSDTHRFTVTPEDRDERLDRFLGEHITGVSRERVKKAVREGACLLDGIVCLIPSTRLTPGQHIVLTLSTEQSPLHPDAGELRLIYSDTTLAALDKPAGLTVHPCSSCKENTLVHRLIAHFPRLARMEGLRPGIVHRLDKDTSGLLVVALDEGSRLALTRAFAEREVRKEYLALARGVPEPRKGEIIAPIGRHPAHKTKMAVVPENRGGKAAHSLYETIYAEPQGRFSLLKVRILTGRTHQIRVHLAHIGHPLWGDALYAPNDAPRRIPRGQTPEDKKQRASAARQMLHAHTLAFPHPTSGKKIALRCPPPQDFLHTALALSRRTRQLIILGAPGSGKSTLLDKLGKIGRIPCFSADAAVHTLYEAGGDGHFRIRQRFGELYAPDGAPVDRAALFALVRKTPRLLHELEEMIHPLVHHRLEIFWEHAENTGALSAAAEIPLYLESEGKERCTAKRLAAPLLIGVACNEDVRRARLAESRRLSASALTVLDARQWPQERKLAACDIVIDNNASSEQFTKETQKLLLHIRDLRMREEKELAARLAALWT